jgi:hypothetical protein
MTTVEEHAIEDAIWDLRHDYTPAALAVLLHLQEQSHLTHGVVVPMAREEQR